MADTSKLFEINEGQKKAINHDTGPALVVAGPGSGKTFVITHRVKRLIEQGVNPASILVITFTKSAAKQMEQRSYKLIQNSALPVVFATFHSLFFRILISEGLYSASSVLKENEKTKIISDLIIKHEISTDDISEMAKNIISDIDRFKNNPCFCSFSLPENEFKQILSSYTEYLERARKLDFDDMQLKVYELLSKNDSVKKKYRKMFNYIMIDEYQDINKIQYEVVRLLLNDNNNLFVVGDDDQSIYSFRGSCPEIMTGFKEEYNDAEVILLNNNYRCAQSVVDASVNLINQNISRFKKEIICANNYLGKVVVEETDNQERECEYILEFIRNHYEQKGKIAIIARTNSQLEYFAQFFSYNKIEYALKEKTFDIYSHFAVLDIIAYLKLCLGDMSRTNFLRIMNKPDRKISRMFLKENIDLEEISRCQSEKYEDSDLTQILVRDIKFMKKLQPYSAIHYILHKIGYQKYLKKFCKDKKIDYDAVCEIINEIIMLSKRFCTIDSFIDSINEYREEFLNSKKDNHEKDEENAVKILTMHGAKGLEFEYVFIVDAVEGITPSKRAIAEEKIEEERRLFYVAMTRACKELYIIYPKIFLLKEVKKSRFVYEIMG